MACLDDLVNLLQELKQRGICGALVSRNKGSKLTSAITGPSNLGKHVKESGAFIGKGLTEVGTNGIPDDGEHCAVIRNVGYLLTEDPTYITNYNSARSLICKLDRDELMQELVRCYLFEKK